MSQDTITCPPASTEGVYTLCVDVRLQSDGPVVTQELVTADDLCGCYDELLLEGPLRHGHPEATVDDLVVRLLPGGQAGGGASTEGFLLEATAPTGSPTRRLFTVHALADTAERASLRLLATGLLKDGELYYYGASLGRRACGEAEPNEPPAPPTPPFTVTRKRRPLTYLSLPLRVVLERAEDVEPTDGACFPVFYTREAFAKAERFSRRGALYDPPVESGGVLLGPVCSCPETGELFVVICDVLDLVGASEQEFSLTYSGQTWADVQARARDLQSRPATGAWRFLGSTHGHNFLPHYQEKNCSECESRSSCRLTSVFVSNADRKWTQAVFAGQPWATCHVFGHGARSEEVHGLFGARDGRLLRRGYHLIAAFDPIALGARQVTTNRRPEEQ